MGRSGTDCHVPGIDLTKKESEKEGEREKERK